MKSTWFGILGVLIIVCVIVGFRSNNPADAQDSKPPSSAKAMYWDKDRNLEILVVEDTIRGRLVYITRDLNMKSTSSCVVNK